MVPESLQNVSKVGGSETALYLPQYDPDITRECLYDLYIPNGTRMHIQNTPKRF